MVPHLQVVATLVRRLREYGQFAVVLHDIVSVQHLLDDLIVGSLVLEERIVHVTASSRVDSQHVASPLVLEDSFTNVLLVLEVCRLLQWLEERRVLDGIVIDKPFNVRLDLVTRLTTINLLVVATASA